MFEFIRKFLEINNTSAPLIIQSVLLIRIITKLNIRKPLRYEFHKLTSLISVERRFYLFHLDEISRVGYLNFVEVKESLRFLPSKKL
jgi:hypothetical protein